MQIDWFSNVTYFCQFYERDPSLSNFFNIFDLVSIVSIYCLQVYYVNVSNVNFKLNFIYCYIFVFIIWVKIACNLKYSNDESSTVQITGCVKFEKKSVWKESKWRIEFGIFVYFLSGSLLVIFITFIYYNIIILCHTSYFHDHLY